VDDIGKLLAANRKAALRGLLGFGDLTLGHVGYSSRRLSEFFVYQNTLVRFAPADLGWPIEASHFYGRRLVGGPMCASY
jgi:hypothetical protein